MVLGKNLLFLIGNGAEIRPLEMGRKGPESIGMGNKKKSSSTLFCKNLTQSVFKTVIYLQTVGCTVCNGDISFLHLSKLVQT